MRELDKFRAWDSLDDERLCLVCGHLITGRQIQVFRQAETMRLRCPTDNCSSISMDWALPKDEVNGHAGSPEAAAL